MGGALAALQQGYVQQREIQDAAYRALQAIESNEDIVVGVNAYEIEETLTLEKLKVDPAIEHSQRAKLATLRATRDPARVAELRTRLDATARTSENLLPLFVECVENDLTLGEICHTLRGVWGEYQASSWI
jgi:methylmalonyl-CoA mutase N-terminal domain/subunit